MRVACVALCAASVCAVAAPLPHGDATHDRQWLYAETLSRGPKDWGVMLDAAGNVRYETCGTGTEQSPVNLASTTVNSALHALTPSYAAATELTVENTGSAIKVTPPHPADNHVVDPNLGGKKFEFSHITFHSPSEVFFLYNFFLYTYRKIYKLLSLSLSLSHTPTHTHTHSTASAAAPTTLRCNCTTLLPRRDSLTERTLR